MKIKIGLFMVALVLCVLMNPKTVSAEELDICINGKTNITALMDGSYKTDATFKAGDKVVITAASGEPINGIYIIWNSPVAEWTLETDYVEETHGKNGFLHEYVPIELETATAIIHIPENQTRICDIRIFAGEELPEDVQVWEPACEKADIMLFSSHADDEILFMGGILPTYIDQRNAKIQLVYMSNYWNGARIREHEKLDGIWTCGVRNYPVNAPFDDLYAKDIAAARTVYNEDDMVEFMVKMYRSFKPQVVVTHDFAGEYGHGYHELVAAAAARALEESPREDCYPDTLETYGGWDVPKAYFHLYKEQPIELDLRVPLESFGGKTALEIAQEAYKKHVSQQWCWFYVSDDYEYSCDEFGLYKTNVGEDSGNDMLENIVTYQEQYELALEESRQAEEASIRESESIEASIAESIEQSIEQSIAESIEESVQESLYQEQQRIQEEKDNIRNIITLFVALGMVGVLIFVVKNTIQKKK